MKLLNIRSDELGKVVLTWLMCAFLAMGYAIGWSAIHAMLVKRMGVEYLPYTYIGISVLAMLGSGLYLMFADTIRRDRLLIYFCTGTVIMLLTARFFVDSRHTGDAEFTWPLVIFFTLVLGGQGLGNSTLTVQVWTMINDVFRPAQGRRLYPIIGTAGAIGGILGGLSINMLVSTIGTANLVIVWVLSIAAVIPLTLVFKKRYGGELHGVKSPSRRNSESSQEGRLENLKSGFRFVMGSPFFRLISGLAIFFWVVSSIQDFQYTRIMNLTFSSEETLSKYYGYYSIGFNATAMLLHVFFTGKIIQRLGVGRSLCALPMVIMIGFAAIMARFSFIPGLTMRYTWDVVGMTLQGGAYQLAFNAAPVPFRGRVRGFLEGVVNPLGGILGGLALIIIGQVFSLDASSAPEGLDIISLVGAVISLVWLVFALTAQGKYVRSIVTNLNSDDRRTFLDAVESLEERGNPLALQKLLDIVNRKDKPAQLAGLRVLPKLGQLEAVPNLMHLLHDPDEELRTAAIQSLRSFPNIREKPFLAFNLEHRIKQIFTSDESLNVRAEAARFLIENRPAEEMPVFVNELLDHPDPDIRTKVVETVSELNMEFVDLSLERMLEDAHPEVKAQAVAALWEVPRLQGTAALTLQKLLDDETAEARAAGLTVVIRFGIGEYLPKVEPLLDVDMAGVRDRAALAILSAGDRNIDSWGRAVKTIVDALCDTERSEVIRNDIIPRLPQLSEDGLDAVLMSVALLPEEKRDLAAAALSGLYSQFQKLMEQSEE